MTKAVKPKRTRCTVEQAVIQGTKLARLHPSIKQITPEDAANLFNDVDLALYSMDILRQIIRDDLRIEDACGPPEIFHRIDDIAAETARALDSVAHYLAQAVKIVTVERNGRKRKISP